MTLARQTYSTKELHEMTGWAYSTIYRKVHAKKLVTLSRDEGEGRRGEGFRFPIATFHAMYPELKIPFQLELPLTSKRKGKETTMRMILLALVALFALVTPVHAASHTISWTQEAGVIADNTELERAPVAGGRCGTFARITTVPFGTLTYVDTAAPNGFVCYRARNVALIDVGDGGLPVPKISPYSPVDSNKPGSPPRLQVGP